MLKRRRSSNRSSRVLVSLREFFSAAELAPLQMKSAVGIACSSHRLPERWESPVMCLCGGLAEDNARIILLAVVLAAYMLAGAALFQRLESDLEIRQVQKVYPDVYIKNYSYFSMLWFSRGIIVDRENASFCSKLRDVTVIFVRSTSR